MFLSEFIKYLYLFLMLRKPVKKTLALQHINMDLIAELMCCRHLVLIEKRAKITFLEVGLWKIVGSFVSA